MLGRRTVKLLIGLMAIAFIINATRASVQQDIVNEQLRRAVLDGDLRRAVECVHRGADPDAIVFGRRSGQIMACGPGVPPTSTTTALGYAVLLGDVERARRMVREAAGDRFSVK